MSLSELKILKLNMTRTGPCQRSITIVRHCIPRLKQVLDQSRLEDVMAPLPGFVQA